MGHSGKVGEHWVAVDVLTQSQWDFILGISEAFIVQQFTQRHRYAILVGNLNAYGVFSWYRRNDVNPFSLSGSGDIRFEGGDSAHSQAFGWVNLIPCDTWTTGDVAREHFEAKGA